MCRRTIILRGKRDSLQFLSRVDVFCVCVSFLKLDGIGRKGVQFPAVVVIATGRRPFQNGQQDGDHQNDDHHHHHHQIECQ